MEKSVRESSDVKIPLKRRCDTTSSATYLAEGKKMQQIPPSSCSSENVDQEEWVTVSGFTQGDTNFVLREFEKCGGVLEHFTGSGDSNWMHILYQNRSDALKALSKNGMQIKRDVILGVKPVDSSQRQLLNEKRIKEHEKTLRTQKRVDGDRISRALNQSIHLLHRFEGDFFILGATANVYTVTLSRIPSCNCPDHHDPCKHMLFVFLRVLGVSRNDDCLKTKALSPCQLTRLRNTPASPYTLASACERLKFHRIFSRMSNVGPPQKIQLKKGARCRFCEGGLKNTHDVVECQPCRAVGHKDCLIIHKVRRGYSPNCMCCWEPWFPVSDEHRYLNLTTYHSESSEDNEDSDDEEESGDNEDSEDNDESEDNEESEDDMV